MFHTQLDWPALEIAILLSERLPPGQLTGQSVSAMTIGFPNVFAVFVSDDLSVDSVARES